MYPEVTLAQARGKKDEAHALLATGKDPGEAKKDQQRQDLARRGNTFEAMAKDFISKAAAEGRAPATQAKTEWLLAMAIAGFGGRPITEVTAPMILVCLRKIEAKGNHETAKRLRAKIGAVFKYAVAVGLAEADPTFSLQGALIRPTAKPRAAITDERKLGGLLRAIDGFQGQTVTRLALSLLVLLVPRPGELRKARWAEFDIKAKVWSIPAERMKMRRAHQVPLAADSGKGDLLEFDRSRNAHPELAGSACSLITCHGQTSPVAGRTMAKHRSCRLAVQRFQRFKSVCEEPSPFRGIAPARPVAMDADHAAAGPDGFWDGMAETGPNGPRSGRRVCASISSLGRGRITSKRKSNGVLNPGR